MHNDLQHLHLPQTDRHHAALPSATGPCGPTTLECAPFASHQWRQNRLLGLLPEDAWQRLRPQIELVSLPLGTALQQPGSALHSAYFPITAIISLLCQSEDGGCVEIAAVGHEGVLGVGTFMGGQGGRAVVRGEGHAYRIEISALQQEFDRCEAVMRLLLRYTQTLMTQMAQTAVCNRHHTLEQQLCRWLLGSLDRTSGSSLAMTHELIAGAIGVRREGITQAAGRLRKRGAIECGRGRIEVVDRPALEAGACECYEALRADIERLLPAAA
jgi:CRP-like cAMP-binding protein